MLMTFENAQHIQTRWNCRNACNVDTDNLFYIKISYFYLLVLISEMRGHFEIHARIENISVSFLGT